MRSRDEVLELAQHHKLGPWAEELVRTVRAGWRLEPQAVGEAAGGGSRVGGLPDLAESEAWPLNQRGLPMTFLAQIDGPSLPPVPGPWSSVSPPAPPGLLRLFADLMDSPVDVSRATALLCPTGTFVHRATQPPLPAPWPVGGPTDAPGLVRYASFPESPVKARPCLSAPETHPVLRPETWQSGATPDAYANWCDQLRAGTGTPHDHVSELLSLPMLFGEPSSVQDDVREFAALHASLLPRTQDEALHEPDAWSVLFSLSDSRTLGLEIPGAFTLLMPKADVSHARYDRVICAPEAG